MRKFHIGKLWGSFAVGLVLIGVVIGVVLNQAEEKAPEDDGKVTIGFCTDTMVIERWQRDKDIFMASAKEQGYDVIVLNANEDNKKQNSQIRSLINMKVDVIVIIPYDKEGITESVKAARKAGIKVISYDRLIYNANVDAYISFDNEKVGELMAQSLMDVAPKGNYVIINGSPNDNNSYMFNRGYKNVLQPAIDLGDIQVIEEVWAEDWREDVAYDTVNGLLASGVEINAIIGANDRLAEAAIKSLTEHGLAGKIPVAGHDADISACQRIIEGTQLMTVYKPIKTLAEAAVELAGKMAENEFVEVEDQISDGSNEVPYFKYDVIPVNKDNMEQTVIKDGFHSKEDVYRNSTGE